VANYVQEIRKYVGKKPIFMPGAGVVLYDSRAEEIVMQKRSDNGCWGIFGGAMEFGEQPEDTAKRELFEESGVQATALELIGVEAGQALFHEYPNGDQVYNVACLFVCKAWEGTPHVHDDESLEIKRFSISALPASEVWNPPDYQLIQRFLSWSKVEKIML
jgi:8-oxo-dGTP pyrophosphatase MutT (NUDIX family)